MVAGVRAWPLVDGLNVTLKVVVIQEVPAAVRAGVLPSARVGAPTTTAAVAAFSI